MPALEESPRRESNSSADRELLIRNVLEAVGARRGVISERLRNRELELLIRDVTTVGSVMIEKTSSPASLPIGGTSSHTDDMGDRGQCFSCGFFGHGVNRCPRLDRSFPYSPCLASPVVPTRCFRPAVFTVGVLLESAPKELPSHSRAGPSLNFYPPYGGGSGPGAVSVFEGVTSPAPLRHSVMQLHLDSQPNRNKLKPDQSGDPVPDDTSRRQVGFYGNQTVPDFCVDVDVDGGGDPVPKPAPSELAEHSTSVEHSLRAGHPMPDDTPSRTVCFYDSQTVSDLLVDRRRWYSSAEVGTVGACRAFDASGT